MINAGKYFPFAAAAVLQSFHKVGGGSQEQTFIGIGFVRYNRHKITGWKILAGSMRAVCFLIAAG